MKKKTKTSSPSFETLRNAPNDDARNRLLLEWLSDDEHRGSLFHLINLNGGFFDIPSRDVAVREDSGLETGAQRPPPRMGHKDVRLVTRRAFVEAALLNEKKRYSSRIYAELGGGSFMLALDPSVGTAHAQQRAMYDACFPSDQDGIVELSRLACDAAAVMALRAPEFDLATFARQAAVRFCQKLMGYAFTDYPMLEGALQAGYDALVYQVFGRHFTTNPLAIFKGKQEMAKLITRTSALIDAYVSDDDDVLKGCKDKAVPGGHVAVLKRLGKYPGEINGEQRAVVAAGAAVGTVGNVQAAVCIAVKALFADVKALEEVRKLIAKKFDDKQVESQAWQRLIEPSLRANPPIPFLPRWDLDGDGRKGQEVLLALGGDTRGAACPHDTLAWGLRPHARHWCAGMDLGGPLIAEIVRHVMSLPKVAERLDAEDAKPIGLKKRWGFACESYPLTHQREDRVMQSSLNVAMRLRTPVQENAARVREVIRSGAPVIEEALRSSKHVHFAWFELIEGDTVLVLHTVYDGPFAAYIAHFALKVGELFDALFECIENPPPMPVNKFPNEFVAHIQRYDRAPAAGYFFSAYPKLDVTHIERSIVGRP